MHWYYSQQLIFIKYTGNCILANRVCESYVSERCGAPTDSG